MIETDYCYQELYQVRQDQNQNYADYQIEKNSESYRKRFRTQIQMRKIHSTFFNRITS